MEWRRCSGEKEKDARLSAIFSQCRCFVFLGFGVASFSSYVRSARCEEILHFVALRVV